MDDLFEPRVSPTSPISPTTKPEPKPEKTKQPPSARLPPPALFQGPPSRHTSNMSLHLPASVSAVSTAPEDHVQDVSLGHSPGQIGSKNSHLSPSRPVLKGIGSTFSRQPADTPNAKRENDRADALWVEMQNTLAEVELSAANGSHIFGAGHAKALEELRKAQLGLAQSWAKSEADEVGSHATRDDAEGVGMAGPSGPGVVGGKEKDGKNGPKQQQQQQQQWQRPGSAGNDGSEKDRARGKTLEEETENDMLLARTRREANDRYFEQVNNSVLDVVRKLDEVAGGMKRVEKESRDIWSEYEDEDGSESARESATGSTTGG